MCYLLFRFSLLAFSKFEDTHDALAATSKLIKGKIPKKLKKFLKKNVISQEIQETLASRLIEKNMLKQ